MSPNTGSNRDYRVYPYGGYEAEGNPRTLMPLPSLDDRRPPKERVLGIPFGEGGGTVFPFGALRDLGDLAVVHESVGGTGAGNAVVVFWDSDAVAAAAFRPRVGVQDLTFEVTNGAFVDVETGSRWSIDGEALSGPLGGFDPPDRYRGLCVVLVRLLAVFPEPGPLASLRGMSSAGQSFERWSTAGDVVHIKGLK